MKKKKINMNKKLATNFRLREFYNPNDKGTTWRDRDGNTVTVRPMPAQELVDTLQAIRSRINKPVHLTSGVRSEQRNAQVRGSARSAHMSGHAADFVVHGMTATQLFNVVRAMHGYGMLPHLAFCYRISSTVLHVGVDVWIRRNSMWG